MEKIRTDLAVEERTPHGTPGADDGVIYREYTENGFNVTVTEIKEGQGSAATGKGAGVYVTVDVGKLWLDSSDTRRKAAETLKAQIIKLAPKGVIGTALVVGLGNEEITPDSIGPKTVKRLVVTHHMKTLDPKLYSALKLGDMAAIAPGVLGQTGVESAALVTAAAECIKPDCIIAIDALAARNLERLGTTIQLTSAGIAPGSGVHNARAELSEKALGCPVIAIGVPTVVDAPSLLKELGDSDRVECKSFFVTPKENDVMTRVLAEVIAAGINSAVHAEADDVQEYAPI